MKTIIVKDFGGLCGKKLTNVQHTPDGILMVFEGEDGIDHALMLSATDDEHGREPYVIYQQDEKLVQMWLNK